MTSASDRTLPIPRQGDRSPLREPSPVLGPVGQALDLLDCIDDAQSWAEEALGSGERFLRSLPERAAALSLTTGSLRRLVAACLGTEAVDPWSIAPANGERLVRDLLAVREAMATVRTRSRAAGKHVIRLALQAPALVRRAQAALAEEDEPNLTTKVWIDGLPERAKELAERSRLRLGGLPVRADALHASLERAVVARPRRRARVPTDRLLALAAE
ncbi:MAG: hypothetical protein H6712_06895 [Myxococcales bacterium]|nr:hypothetical protein [Myxococcales bacterium]